MHRSLTPVSVVCPSDLAGLAKRASETSVSSNATDSNPALELSAVEAELVRSEVSRAANAGSGVVALARAAEDVTRLRIAGADRVVLAEGSLRELGAEIIRAAYEAHAEARERRRRAEHLAGLIQDVSAGAVKAETLLADIGIALLERPIQVLADPGDSPYGATEVLAELRASVNVVGRVHALQGVLLDGVSDVATLTREIAPMLRVAFGGDVRIRVVTRGGPFIARLPDWCVAVILLAVGVALASTRNGAPEAQAQTVLDGPLPGQNRLSIHVVGSPGLVTLEVTTDVANPDALPDGMIHPDMGSAADPARAALALAAQCLKACEGSVYVDSDWHGGSIVTVFIPVPASLVDIEV